MNNPLAQRAQYYLNESSRLSEELNTEIEYSAVLEAVLEELVGTENFLKIMEFYVPKPGVSATHKVVDGKRVERTNAEKERYGAHLGKIMDIRDRAASGVYDAQYAFTQAHKRVQQTDQHQGAFNNAKSIQLRAHGALTLQGGNTGDDPAKHPKMMNFASGGATPEQRASVGVARPAEPAGGRRGPVTAIAAQTNDVTDAIAAKRASNAARNVQTGAAGSAMAFNAAGRGESISVGSRGKGGTPRTVETGTRKNRQGLLFPVNASYEPDLVQGIMNLLANSRNENALSEGQAKMLRMQDSAKRQQKKTGTVNPGLASDLNRAKTQNIIKALGTTQLPGAMVSGNDMGYIGTPQLQRLRVGERLTGMRAAGEDRSSLSHSLVSASRNTGNFHPDTDGAGGDVGHVDKVHRYGKVKAELGQSISQAHREARAMEAAKRRARVAFETTRTRTPEEIKQLKIGIGNRLDHTRKITQYRATNNKDTSGNAPI